MTEVMMMVVKIAAARAANKNATQPRSEHNFISRRGMSTSQAEGERVLGPSLQVE